MNNRIGYFRLKELNFELERRELGVLCKNVLPFGSITEKKLKECCAATCAETALDS